MTLIPDQLAGLLRRKLTRPLRDPPALYGQYANVQQKHKIIDVGNAIFPFSKTKAVYQEEMRKTFLETVA